MKFLRPVLFPTRVANSNHFSLSFEKHHQLQIPWCAPYIHDEIPHCTARPNQYHAQYAPTCHSSMVCTRDTRTSCPHAQFCRTTAQPKPNVIFSYRYYTRQCQNNKTLSCATEIKNHLTVVSISPSTLRHARTQIYSYSDCATNFSGINALSYLLKPLVIKTVGSPSIVFHSLIR